MGSDDLFKKRRESRKQRRHEYKTPRANSFLIMGFSLLNCLEFFVFRKMENSSTLNHPLCGCATDVIQKLPSMVQ
jgi:hypothetical protein